MSVRCTPSPITVGFAGPLTGPYSDLGVQGRNGAQLAVERVDAEGGIAGRELELMAVDDEGTEDGARRVADELVNADVTAVIGHMTSDQTVAALPIMNEAETVLISPTTSTPLLDGRENMLFRPHASTDRAAMVLGRYAAQDGSCESLAIVRDTDNEAYSDPFHRFFKQEYTAFGGDVVLDLSVASRQSPDWRSVVGRIADANPQGVFLILSARDSAQFIQALRASEYQPAVFSSEWAMTGDFVRAGGRAVDGTTLVTTAFLNNPTSRYQEFRRRYRERFGTEASFAAERSYNSVTVLAEALRHTGGNADGLPKALVAVEDLPGLLGPITLDEYGDAVSSVHVIRVEDGEFVELEEIPVEELPNPNGLQQ